VKAPETPRIFGGPLASDVTAPTHLRRLVGAECEAARAGVIPGNPDVARGIEIQVVVAFLPEDRRGLAGVVIIFPRLEHKEVGVGLIEVGE